MEWFHGVAISPLRKPRKFHEHGVSPAPPPPLGTHTDCPGTGTGNGAAWDGQEITESPEALGGKGP